MNSTKTPANDSTREGAARNLVSISPFFIVKDLQASIAFYRERLGFQLDFDGPEGDVYYAGVSRDGIGIMLRQRGVPFVKELSFIDDGLWGFEIADADGYVLAFFQVRNK